jgi:uncharacterized phage infection (PIP) family protein YhgE
MNKLLRYIFGTLFDELSALRTEYQHGLNVLLADILSVRDKLNSIEGTLKIMANREKELDDTINNLATTVGEGFSQLNNAVASATDRVILALEKKGEEEGVDLDDEISALGDLQATVNSGVAATVASLNSLLPTTSDQIPVPDSTTNTTEGDSSTTDSGATDAGTDSSPASEQPAPEGEGVSEEEATTSDDGDLGA